MNFAMRNKFVVLLVLGDSVMSKKVSAHGAGKFYLDEAHLIARRSTSEDTKQFLDGIRDHNVSPSRSSHSVCVQRLEDILGDGRSCMDIMQELGSASATGEPKRLSSDLSMV
ncbi:MAG: hypothetical protein ACXV39_10750 [Halobacteriota archaeon]